MGKLWYNMANSYNLTEEYKDQLPEWSSLIQHLDGTYEAIANEWRQAPIGIDFIRIATGKGRTPEEAIDTLNTELKKIK